MAHHVPNRRSLDPDETAALDAITSAYLEERARAYDTCYAAITKAVERRDEAIAAIVDAVDPETGRGTQARIAEYLRMNRSHLTGCVNAARARIAARDNENATGL